MSKFIQILKNNKALSWVLGFQAFRFIILPFMGLMPQDAYYYLYGQHLSLSYFDHPGMIGYALRLSSEIFGQSVFVIKLTDFLITSATLFSFYQLAQVFLSKQKKEKAIVLLASTICISILSFNSTPDVPLLLFWTMSLLFLYKAIFLQKKWFWVFAGISMGLAFNSKYTALLLQFGLLAFLVFSSKYRKLLLSRWFWLCLLISISVTFPVWYWNYQNDFASFAFQSSERTSSIAEFKFYPNFFFGAIAHQLLLVLPVVFLSFIIIAFKYIKRFVTKLKLPTDQTLFLLAFFIPTFLGFMAITPIYWVKLNWLMPAYISGIILASLFIAKKYVKLHLVFSIVFHLLLVIEIMFYVVPIKSDDTWVGWEELATKTLQLKQQHQVDFIFSDDYYKTSACLNFYLDEKVYAQNIIGKHALHFDYLGDDLSALTNKNALYVDSDKRFKDNSKKGNHPKSLQKYFSAVTELEPIIISVNDKKVRKFWVYLCKNYKAKP